MKYITYILLLSITTNTYAQLTPEFQMTLYLEDAQGHQDSVIIGYDSLATDVGIDTHFGEADMTNQPWDSLFEARVSPAGNRYSNLGKKQFGKYWCTSYDDGGYSYTYVIISIRTQSAIKTSWNQLQFIDTCHQHSVLVRNDIYFAYPWTDYGKVFLNTQDTQVYSYTDMLQDVHQYTAPIEGGGTATIFHMYVGFVYDIDLLINTKEIHKKDLVKVYPNPVQTQLNIELNEGIIGQQIEIYDVTGRQVWQSQSKDNQYQVYTADWAKGMYFYKIQTTENTWTSGRFIKY